MLLSFLSLLSSSINAARSRDWHFAIMSVASKDLKFGSEDSLTPFCTDMLIAAAALVVLAACGAHCQELSESKAALKRYAHEKGFALQWQQASRRDCWFVFLVWFGSVAIRACLAGNWQRRELIHLALLTVSSSALAGAGFLVIHISHGMVYVVTSFMVGLFTDTGLAAAKQTWNLSCALLRKTSDALQLCYAALAATAVLASLLAIRDVAWAGSWALIPNLIVTLSIPRVLLRAAFVTDVCKKIPPLMISLDSDECDLADDTMLQLVQHLTAFEAGFYMFDARVSTGLVRKFVYFTGVAGFAIGSNLFSL
ncbi:unnamed protein product [Polarella glacialis]|uniref:Solute carrier family 40 protein n=1 Tax=Polarella glacialis TaxID=89957 RepID=A0A813JSH5_POLGL|nr:unnamed protein product [Polarella glacialis]